MDPRTFLEEISELELDYVGNIRHATLRIDRRVGTSNSPRYRLIHEHYAFGEFPGLQPLHVLCRLSWDLDPPPTMEPLFECAITEFETEFLTLRRDHPTSFQELRVTLDRLLSRPRSVDTLRPR